MSTAGRSIDEILRRLEKDFKGIAESMFEAYHSDFGFYYRYKARRYLKDALRELEELKNMCNSEKGREIINSEFGSEDKGKTFCIFIDDLMKIVSRTKIHKIAVLPDKIIKERIPIYFFEPIGEEVKEITGINCAPKKELLRWRIGFNLDYVCGYEILARCVGTLRNYLEMVKSLKHGEEKMKKDNTQYAIA